MRIYRPEESKDDDELTARKRCAHSAEASAMDIFAEELLEIENIVQRSLYLDRRAGRKAA